MIRFISLPPNKTLKQISTLLATGLGSGLVYPAPGTWGSFAGLFIALPFLIFTSPLIIGIMAVFFTLSGLWASKKYIEDRPEQSDPSEVVIDEIAGIFVALIPCPADFFYIAVTFVIFRFFDIVKPWPIGLLDKNIKGASGIMADDILAGIFTAILVIGIQFIGI